MSSRDERRSVACPRCHAPVGVACRTSGGNVYEDIHRARRAAYRNTPQAPTATVAVADDESDDLASKLGMGLWFIRKCGSTALAKVVLDAASKALETLNEASP